MANDSATGGYLQPSPDPAPQPLEGKPLLAFLQSVVVGISGLDGPMVRPRWQAEPPDIPTAGTCWCSMGINNRASDTFPYVGHDGAAAEGEGADKMQRQEQLDILCSFYDLGVEGLADKYAALLRDGFAIAQNREVLQLAGYSFAFGGDLVTAPVLLKVRWQYRVDYAFSIRRQIDRTYPVLNLRSAQGQLISDNPNITVDFVVDNQGD